MKVLLELAKAKQCYKIVLDCKEDRTEFYTKCGFHQRGMQMALYFDKS